MTDNMLMDRIFAVFLPKENCIQKEQWLLGLSILLKGSLSEQSNFCFNVYDLSGSGFITREHIGLLLRTCMVGAHQSSSLDDREEALRELVELSIKKMDHDLDGRLSFSDFDTSVKKDAMLLEVFGPCLPTAYFVSKFLGGSLTVAERFF